MIFGIGVDTVEIDRFALWHTYTRKKLSRIFSHDEIEYCLVDTKKSAERFAVRFAAREALYKAFSNAFPHDVPAFLTLCRYVTIKKINSRPVLELNNQCGLNVSAFTIHLSLTHSRSQATAFVIIENK